MRRIVAVLFVLAGLIAMQALAEDAPPSPDETRRAKVVATVGSETITVGQLEDIVNSRSPYARQRFLDPAVLQQLAEDQVQNALFYQGAEKLGYGDDPVVRQFLDQTLIQLFVRKEFQESVPPESVPDKEIAKYYEDNPEEFRRPEMRRARHILVASKKEAQGILRQLASDESSTFRALAKQKSLDTETKLRGGDLLYFERDGTVVGKQDGAAIDATLVKAAFRLEKTGDMSKPLNLGDGKWSVLELTGIRPEKIQTFEQASGLIRRKLWREERESALDELMTDLRAELKPETFPERMEAIVLEPSSEPIEPPNQ